MKSLLSKISALLPGRQAESPPPELQMEEVGGDCIQIPSGLNEIQQYRCDSLKRALMAEKEVGNAIKILNRQLVINMLGELIDTLSESPRRGS